MKQLLSIVLMLSLVWMGCDTQSTSPGITDILSLDKAKFVNSIVKINKELQWMDPSNRGYLSLDCRKTKIIASFNFIKEIERINPEIGSSQSFVLLQEELGLEEIKT